MKVKYPKNKRNNRLKKNILVSFAVLLILSGMGIMTVNLMKFVQGYSAYHAGNLLSKAAAPFDTGKADTLQINEPGAGLNIGVSTGAAAAGMNTADNAAAVEKIQPVLYPERPDTGDDIGELYIPALDVTIPIYEGTGADELDKGAGHFTDSVLPGEDDNCVLSGHRDTVFRELGKVEIGDLLVIRTSAGDFEYKVNKIRIVDKDDKTVIVPKPRAALTVSTCYPFTYIGPAPKRYILEAYLSSETLNGKTNNNSSK